MSLPTPLGYGDDLGPALDREGGAVPWFCRACQRGWRLGGGGSPSCPGCGEPLPERTFAVSGEPYDPYSLASNLEGCASILVIAFGVPATAYLGRLVAGFAGWVAATVPWVHPRALALSSALIVPLVAWAWWRRTERRWCRRGVGEVGPGGLRISKGLWTTDYAWDEWEGYLADLPDSVRLRRRGKRLNSSHALPTLSEDARVAVLGELDRRGIPRLDGV